ncbi:hypothetical protein CCP2SC5_650016 [Azospirillaceae bacterium]
MVTGDGVQSLPAWLSFDAATRAFSGTAPTDASDLSIRVTANDGNGGNASSDFTLDVNHNPNVINSIVNQSVVEERSVDFTIPSNTFSDPDGDALTYTAQVVTGDGVQPLPAWLSFDAATRTFSGTIPADTPDLSIRVIANDGNGGSVSSDFTLDVNHLPEVVNSISNQAVIEEQPVNFTVPSNTFTDPDGDALTYTAQVVAGDGVQPLPAWLSFDAATRTFSGTIPNDAPDLAIRVTANDGKEGTVSSDFTLDINHNPNIINSIANQSVVEERSINFTVPSNTFSDPDGDALAYTAQAVTGDGVQSLPAWLSFDAATRTFSGTAPSNASNQIIRVTANDGKQGSVSSDFTLAINHVPNVDNALSNQFVTGGQSVNFTVPSNTFTDPDGDALTYAAQIVTGGNVQSLPSWLSFDAVTRTFSGTVPTDAPSLTIRVIANDGREGNVGSDFTLTVNHAPTANIQISSHSATERQSVNFTIPTNIFSDPDGDALTYTAQVVSGGNAQSLPSWLSFDAATFAFSGAVPSNTPDLTIRILADDGRGGSVGADFTLETPINRAPIVDASISNQFVIEQQLFNFTIPSNTFTDPDGNALTYSAEVVRNGVSQRLPSWLNFDSETRTFIGVAPINSPDQTIRITADDGNGLSSTLDFTLETLTGTSTIIGSIADLFPSGRISPDIVPGVNVIVTGDATVAQLNLIDSTNESGITCTSGVNDSVVNIFLSGYPSRFIADGTNVTVSDAVSVYQISAIDAANGFGGMSVAGINDTISNLFPSGAPSQFITAGINVTVSDTASISQIVALDDANGVGEVNVTTISDTISNLLPSGTPHSLVKSGMNISVLDTVNISQIVSLDDANGNGDLNYTSLRDTVSNLLSPSHVSNRILSGVEVTAVGVLSLTQTIAIDRANGHGNLTYTDITDRAVNLIRSGQTSSRIVSGTNVTILDAASIHEIESIDQANGSGSLSYNTLKDSVAHLLPSGVSSRFISSGTNVVISDAASIAQIAAIDAANGDGTLSYTTLKDSVANLLPSDSASSRIQYKTNVVVTNAASIAQLSAIDSANGPGILSYSSIADSVGNLLSSTYVKSGINVTVVGAATSEQLSSIDSKNSYGVLSWKVSETTDISDILSVRNLHLSGSENIDGTGNRKNNIITGNSGTNTLSGGDGNDTLVGREGNDTLIGGYGEDVFRYVSTSDGGDSITDFQRGLDKIQIVSPNFGNITSSQISTGSAFVSNSTGVAIGSSSQIIFNTSNGNLYYDEDGVGAGSSVLLATLNVRNLSASDIMVSSS